MRGVCVAAGLLLAACSAEAQVAQREPLCRAERQGEHLITYVVFPDGYVVEGPWHVTSPKRRDASITAVLDHIVEKRTFSDARRMTELPGPIQMTFNGETLKDVLAEAATVWCNTVLSVRPPPIPQHHEDEVIPNRVI